MSSRDIDQNKGEPYYIKSRALPENIDEIKNNKDTTTTRYFEKQDTTFCTNSFNNPMAYVLNGGSNSMSVVDVRLAKRITDIPLGNFPWEIDISLNKKFIYVSNYDDGTLMVISTDSNKVVNTINLNSNHFVSSGPTGVKVSPNGRLVYVGNWRSKNILVVDAYEKVVLSEIPIGESVALIDITSDGKFLYATLPSANRVSVVDTHINLPVKYLSVGNYPTGIAIQKSYPLALVAVQGSNNLAVINTEIVELSSARFSTGGEPIELIFHPKYNIAFVVNHRDNNISVIDMFAHRQICTMAVGTSPSDIGITQDGYYIVVPNSEDGTVSIVNTITGKTRTVRVGPNPYSIKVSG